MFDKLYQQDENFLNGLDDDGPIVEEDENNDTFQQSVIM
jgi:hypothetical protein